MASRSDGRRLHPSIVGGNERNSGVCGALHPIPGLLIPEWTSPVQDLSVELSDLVRLTRTDLADTPLTDPPRPLPSLFVHPEEKWNLPPYSWNGRVGVVASASYFPTEVGCGCLPETEGATGRSDGRLRERSKGHFRVCLQAPQKHDVLHKNGSTILVKKGIEFGQKFFW